MADQATRVAGWASEAARWLSRAVGDVLLAAVVSVAMVFGTQGAAEGQVPPREAPDVIAYAFIAVTLVAVLVRRVWPALVLAATVAATSAYLVLGYPHGPIIFGMSIAMYTLAVRWPVRSSLLACGVAVLAVLAAESVWAEEFDALVAPWPVATLVAPWTVGTLVRMGREDTQRRREAATDRRVYEERLRVAREVHDVVGHGLAVINMQAGVALHVLDKRPEQAKPALEAIKNTSKESLDELRGALAVFRQPGAGSAERRPLPGLGQLEELVGAMADSGLKVELEVRGSRAPLPAAVDLAAYRIVQESLTNVLRHAGPATARVRADYRDGEVLLDISDDGRARAGAPTPSGGHGIAGMRERAAAVGGSLDARPRDQGGFLVQARLPTREARP